MKNLRKVVLFLLFSMVGISAVFSQNKKTFKVVEDRFPLTGDDSRLLENFDFSAYRQWNKESIVEVESGPKIKLLSVQELIADGAIFSEDYIQEKKEKALQNTHELIFIVNVGIQKHKSYINPESVNMIKSNH